MNDGLFKFWRLFESKKWRRSDDLSKMFSVVDDMLKTAKNIASFLLSREVLANEGYSISRILSSDEFIFGYRHDILIFGLTFKDIFESHSTNLVSLSTQNLEVKPKECHFSGQIYVSHVGFPVIRVATSGAIFSRNFAISELRSTLLPLIQRVRIRHKMMEILNPRVIKKLDSSSHTYALEQIEKILPDLEIEDQILKSVMNQK
eukprot:g46103.t1